MAYNGTIVLPLQRKTVIPEENPIPVPHFVCYKSDMHYIGNETKSPYSETGEKSLELKHSQLC